MKPAGRTILVSGLLLALLFCLSPISDPDLPWHLSAGRRLLETRSFLRQDFLSWTMEGRPWVDFEWGAEALFAVAERWGGGAGLWLLKSGVLAALTGLLLLLLSTWSLPEVWLGLAAPAFAAALSPLTGPRPELFSLIFFLLELIALERRRLGRSPVSDDALIVLHGAAYVLWANLHAGFVTGLLLCACYGAAEVLERRGSTPLLFAAAGFLGTFVNPYGYRVYGVLADHWRHFESLRGLVIEWTPPSLLKSYLDGYWLLTIFSVAGLVWAIAQGEALPVEHLAAVIAFTIFASRAVRTASYAILLVYPLGLHAWSRVRAPRRLSLAARGLVAVLACGLVLWRGVEAYGRGLVSRPVPVASQGPAGACAFLSAERATLAPLRLYNPYNWGGYIGYRLFPDYKVFIDGRYLFADLLAEVDAAQNDPADWRGFMDERDIGVAVLFNDGLMTKPKDALAGRPYSVFAMPRAEWALVYWDSRAKVFVRRGKVPGEWLARHEYRWLYPHDLRHLGLAVMVGVTTLDGVARELDRYKKEIGDPREVAATSSWLAEFRRGLGQEHSE